MRMKLQMPDNSKNEDNRVRKSKRNGGFYEGFFDDISNASPAKQLTAGGLAGWCAGYVFAKVGKIAGTALAGSIFAFQFAQHQGYIKVNWSKVNKDVNEVRQTLEKRAKEKIPSAVDDATKFVQSNAILAAGFAGGFFLGMASA